MLSSQWFHISTCTPYVKALNETVLPTRLGQLEAALARSGGPYLCGEAMTTCDLSFYVIGEGLVDGTYADGIKPSVMDAFPGLKALVVRISQHPKVVEWNAKHGK